MFAFPAGSQCLPSSASLQMVSDCCQRGPICSRGSQLANSSVCTRSIVVLTKVTRLRVSLPPTQLRLLSLLSFPLGWNLFFFYLFFWSRDSLSPSLMLRRAEAIFVSWSISTPDLYPTDNPFLSSNRRVFSLKNACLSTVSRYPRDRSTDFMGKRGSV